MKFTKFTAAALLLGAIYPAQASDDGARFVQNLAGSWAGGGTVTIGDGEPGATNCRLSNAVNGTTVTIAGSCDGAARGANLVVVIKWSEQTREFVGSFTGGAESGTAQLNGKLNGDTLNLRVISTNGQASTMTLTLAGNRASLRVLANDAASGKQIDVVKLALTKA